MATILFLNRLDDRWMESIRRLKREFSHVEMITYKEAESPRDLLPQADAIVTGYLSREEVRKASRLKAIFVPFAGVNMLPIEDIRQRSIIVSNAHGNAKYVAERALALALALLGRVVEYHMKISKEESGVVISPHVSGIVEEAMQANMEETLENIRSWLTTGEPLNKVDLERMY